MAADVRFPAKEAERLVVAFHSADGNNSKSEGLNFSDLIHFSHLIFFIINIGISRTSFKKKTTAKTLALGCECRRGFDFLMTLLTILIRSRARLKVLLGWAIAQLMG